MFVSTMNEKEDVYGKPRAPLLPNYKTIFILCRGPLVMAAVLLPFVADYIVSLSRTVLLGTLFLIFGIGLFCHDALYLIKNEIRASLMKSLDTIVLDDVMRFIFDPQIGIISGMVAIVIGNASMYSLGMSESQRIRMLQACLLSTEEESRHILTTPGGVRLLLPQPVQEWLEPDTVMKRLEGERVMHVGSEKLQDITVTTTGEEESTTGSDEMSSDPDSNDVDYSTSTNAGTTPVVKEANSPVMSATPKTNIQIHPSSPPDPMIVMGSILKELSVDWISNGIQHMPDAVLQGVSAVTAVALCLHLRASPRARHVFLGMLEGTATVSLAGAALSALTALVIKRSCLKDTSTSRGSTTSSSVQMYLQCWKKWMLSHMTSRQVRATVAFLLLYYVGRVRRQRLNSTPW